MVYKYILVVDNSGIQIHISSSIRPKGIYFSDEIGEDDEFAYFVVDHYERTFRKVK